MRKLLSILIASGLMLAPAFPAQSKPRSKSASHRKSARRGKKHNLRRRTQAHAKPNNKAAGAIPKSRKIV
jgi:Ni/Co efflux regulator RcnB